MRLGWLLAALMVLPGCISRYKAPDGPADTSTPYSALAVYREITPPVQGGGDPLPQGALRVATDGESVFADAALVLGPEHAGISETWAGALTLLQIHGDAPVVVLADAPGLARACAELAAMLPRLTLAVRASEAPMYPLKTTSADAGESKDPLRGVALTCP